MLKGDPVLETVGEIARATRVSVYLVGGVVRNLILGSPAPPDYDFALSGGVASIAAKAAGRLNGTAFILDKDAPSHRVVFKGDGRTLNLDFSPIKGAGITDDLMARDFTVDAMAVDLRVLFERGDGVILDPCNGMKDAKEGVLRVTSPEVFKADPLRLLRAIRLSQQYGLRITPEAIRLMKAGAGMLRNVSPERIRDELVAVFSCKGTSASIRAMYRTRLMESIIPEMGGWVKRTDYDILGHTLAALDEAEALLDGITAQIFGLHHSRIRRHFATSAGRINRAAFFKLAAFFHDIGKPSAMVRDSAGLRFWGHDSTGGLMVMDILKRLKFSRRSSGEISKLVKNHHRVFALADLHNPSGRAKSHLLRCVGVDLGIDLLCLALIDARATRGSEDPGLLAVVRDMTAFYYDVYTKKRPGPVLTGTEIMKTFRIPEGRLVGEITSKIAEGVETGAVRTKKEAALYVRQWLKKKA